MARASQGQKFPQIDMLEALRQDNREVIQQLRKSQDDPSYKPTWEPSSTNLNEKKKRAFNPQTQTTKALNTDRVAWSQVGDRGAFPVFNDRKR